MCEFAHFITRDARCAKCGIAIGSRPSVTLRYPWHWPMGWISSKLITRIFAPRSHNIGNLVQGEQPKNSGRREVKSLFWTENLQYLWNGARPRLLLMTIEVARRCTCAFNWYRNQRRWMTLNGHYALYTCIFGASVMADISCKLTRNQPYLCIGLQVILHIHLCKCNIGVWSCHASLLVTGSTFCQRAPVYKIALLNLVFNRNVYHTLALKCAKIMQLSLVVF